MELRRHQTSHWTIPFVKALFIQWTVMSSSHAVELNNIESVYSRSSIDTMTTSTDDPRLARLDLDNYSLDDTTGLDLYLDVVLNGASAGLVHFVYRDDQLWVSPDILQQLGFILPPDTIEPIALNSFPDIQIDYNSRQQTVSIIAPLSLLNLETTIHSIRSNKRPQPTASPGMLLNYNLYGTQTEDNAASLSAYTELRAFNDFGVISSTALTTTNRLPSQKNWDGQTTRLDTSWSKSFPDQLVTVRVGDILTGALSWTRSTRLGGLQFGTNFDLQPYLTTSPLPSFFGSATLPSAVELYVNGLKQYSGDVPAGPFELNTSPSFSGAGTAQLVITDALGQRSTVNFSLYDAHRLLQTGLSDWSVEIGAVRENYGRESFDYANDIAASGTWRYGVNDRFTIETHAEVTTGLRNTGVGGTFLLGNTGGVLFTSIAGSKSQGNSGSQYSASYSWNNSRFNIGIGSKGTNGDYRDIGTKYGSIPASRSEQFLAGYSTQSLGSFGISYNQIAYEQQEKTKFASAYWRKSFGKHLSLNANINQDISNSDNFGASIGASLLLGHDVSVNSSMQHTDERNILVADLSRSTPSVGGIGWRAQILQNLNNDENSNGGTSGSAQLNYLGRYGQGQIGVSGQSGSYSTYASGAGSLVMMGGGLFPSRRLNSSFAVVSTNGIPNVPILLQNSPIGTTNSKGLLLVSPLNAYQANKIGINPMDLPANMRIDKVSVEATPAEQAGMVVSLDITPVNAASVILQDDKNQVIPVGSTVKMLSRKDVPDTMVGFDGEVYLDMLDAQNIVQVTTPKGNVCQASIEYQSDQNDIPLIGPVVCKEVQK